MEMKVSMNGLRRNIVSSLARLTKKLNCAVDYEVDDGMICIAPEDLRDNMNELQSLVVGLCCVYEEGNSDFVNMSDYVDKNLPDFLPEDEELGDD